MKAIAALLFAFTTLFLSCHCIGTLYGLDPFISRVVKINPTTAAVSPIGRYSYPKELSAQGLSSIDTHRKLYYSIVYNETAKAPYLISLSLHNGVLVTSFKLPFLEQAFIGVGQYCAVIPATGEVLVFGLASALELNYNLLRINVTSKSVTVVTTVHVAINVLGGAAVYDPEHDVFVFEVGTDTGINIVAYSLATRKILFNVSDAVHALETMNWDSVTKMIVGIGFTKGIGERAVVSLNPLNGATSTVARVPGYFLIDAQLAALDENRRILYAYLQPKGTGAEMHLVGVDVTTGKVVSDPIAPHPKPFSIAFDNTL